MKRAIPRIILVIVVTLSCSAGHVNAQFWKKKSKTAPAIDTTVVVQDTTPSVKDRKAAIKDSIALAKKNAKLAQDTIMAVQDTAFRPGENTISFGYGIFAVDADIIRWVYNISGATSSIFGPIYFKFEHAVDYHWTYGVNIAYGHYDITSPTDYGKASNMAGNFQEFRSDNTFSLLGRVNYHFDMAKKWDPYLGMGLGLRTSSSTYTTSDPYGVAPDSYDNKFPIGFEMTAGTRYLFSDNTSLYAEIGLAKSVLQVGFSYKLK